MHIPLIYTNNMGNMFHYSPKKMLDEEKLNNNWIVTKTWMWCNLIVACVSKQVVKSIAVFGYLLTSGWSRTLKRNVFDILKCHKLI